MRLFSVRGGRMPSPPRGVTIKRAMQPLAELVWTLVVGCQRHLPVEMLELVLLKASSLEIMKAAKTYPLDAHSLGSTRLKSVCHDWWLVIGVSRRYHQRLLRQQIHSQSVATLLLPVLEA